MNNQSLVEIKLKANQFIQQYEKQQTQRQYQKQKLKQNVMLDILSNRNKTSSISNSSRIKQNTFTRQQLQRKGLQRKQNAPYSEYRQSSYIQNNGFGNNRSQSVADNSIQNINAEITFKGKQNPLGSFIVKKSHNTQEPQDHHEQNSEFEKQDYDPAIQTQNHQMTFRNQQDHEPLKQYKQFELHNSTDNFKSHNNISNKFKFPEPQIQPDSQEQYQQNQNMGQNSYAHIHRNNSANNKSTKYQNIRKSYQTPQQQEQQIQQEYIQPQTDQKGIFLTVQQNQSMQLTQQIAHKNCAFDIMMDKSEPIDNIDELRKKKIQELDKKRQMRLSEHKKSDFYKKADTSVGKTPKVSNNSKKDAIKISEDPEPQPSRYALNRRKNNNQHQKKANISGTQQSYYNINNPSNASVKRSHNYIPPQDNFSYEALRTPPTISTQVRANKSRNKNTIFKQSPRRAQKSSGKYSQDPKIEPKQRKNTFVKQSNRKLMINAVSHVCLPGQLNRKDREKLIQVIENEQSEFFVFLFKEYSRKVIKAIYTLDHSQTYLFKIYGDKAPQQVISENVKAFYRFDSGSREFKKLDGCKSFSLAVHAIDLR